MKGFALDEKGDLIIENNEIVMVNGNDLLKQNVKSVLSTNKGEWSLNVDEGIDFTNILGKQSSNSEEIIKDEIQAGLASIDGSMIINEFSCKTDSVTRKLIVSFTASNDSGETVEASLEY